MVLVGVAITTVSPILSIVASVRIAENNTQHLLDLQHQQAAKEAETQRRATCFWLGILLDGYEETPPTTQSTRNAQKFYLDYYNDTAHCVPRRK